MSALDSQSLPVEHKALHVPGLDEVAKVLEAGLAKNFAEAKVEVVDCPDLRAWGLAAEGLGGATRLFDVGGVPYLMPTPKKEKLYDMKDYPKLTDMEKGGFVIGAGAGPWPYLNRNAEMMPNLAVNEDGSIIQKTKISRTFDEDDRYACMDLPDSETRNAVLGNLFLSEGKPGKVLKICCKNRTGSKNFVSCMRETLVDHYGEQAVGMGGVFKILSGKVKIHVMPDFSPCPITSDAEVNQWLKFYEVPTPFTVLSTFISRDPGLDLRVEHSHGWGEAEVSSGGHYHYDTTPQQVQYLGYYNLADFIYRLDKPVDTHTFGRD
eukprot:TRINITY_DN5439_c0_g1_i3.p1 TRINITY_DN5439_c0_g1~~TRINITY_DN5439_c0_g1_i3.p1  ORF type:complete len:330 (-),score=69.06 TRINITY_DN5439_c0_g1_i3:54-1016(-)